MRLYCDSFTGMIQKASAISVFAIYAPQPMVLVWAMAWLIVWYCTSAFSDGMPSLIDEPTEWNKCCIILKESMSFFGMTPRGDVTKLCNGGYSAQLDFFWYIFSSATGVKTEADQIFTNEITLETNVKPKSECFYQCCLFLAIALRAPTQVLYSYSSEKGWRDILGWLYGSSVIRILQLNGCHNSHCCNICTGMYI